MARALVDGMAGAGVLAVMKHMPGHGRAFADSHEFVDGQPVRATVSAGVATADPQMDMNDMVAAADKALYSAKHNGRNRVERAPGPDDAAPSHIVRIA